MTFAQPAYFTRFQVVGRRMALFTPRRYSSTLILSLFGLARLMGWRTMRVGLATPLIWNEDRRRACSPTLPRMWKLGRLWGGSGRILGPVGGGSWDGVGVGFRGCGVGI